MAWTRGYREGVALAHGYGHPRLQDPARRRLPRYIAQLAALDAEAPRAKAARWSALDRETRRAICSMRRSPRRACAACPRRPAGQHVVADLMAFYFRSSEANDDCYNAMINREVCRPIAITTRRPEPPSTNR